MRCPPLYAGARNRLYLSGAQINLAKEVVLGVGYVQIVAGQRHALGVVERRRLKTSVRPTDVPRADCPEQLAVQRSQDDSIVIAVGNKQPILPY